MKRIIAITLSIIFVLMSFTACSGDKDNNPSSNPTANNSPEATLADVSVTFSKFENAKLNYTSLSEFTTEKDDAFQSMTEEYIFLPEGAVISSDKEFALYIFSDTFAINQVVMQATGQQLDGFNPTPKAGEITLKEDAYARITVKGALSDIKIKVPEEEKTAVMCGSQDVLKYREDIAIANNFYSASANNVNYVFVTDIHYGSEVSDRDGDGKRDYDSLEDVAKKLEDLKGYLDKVVAVVNASPYIDFLVVGGDIVNGYETPDSFNYQEHKKSNPDLTIGKHVIMQHQEILAPLKKLEKPVFILSGNHDDNNGHSIYNVTKEAKWLVSDLDWDKGVFREFINVDVVRDPDYSYNGKSISKYYYYDLTKNNKTTRIICLDYNDDRFTFDSKGEVTAQPNWGGYHESQIRWLASVALNGDFDECIILSHQGYKNYEGSGIRDDLLDRTLEAYQTKSRMKMTALSVDYADRTGGDIIVYHHGHEHDHARDFDFKKRIWELNTPMMVTAVDLVSVSSDKVLSRALVKAKPIIYEMLRNGTVNQTVQ